MIASSSPVTQIDRFEAIRQRYDALICDVWGVLHNGVQVTPSANAALIAARRQGLAVVMLTNAPRPPADIEKFVRHLGADKEGWDAMVSSGGVTRDIIRDRGDRPFHHIGPKRDEMVFAGLSARPVPLESAEYVLCTGLFDDETEQAETFRPQLDRMLGRGIDMICANPDMVVERGHRLIPCAGAVADLFERMGGQVTWVGKPHPLVYDYAHRAIEAALGRSVARNRLLAIGDALRTDIAGAAAYGIDSLFVIEGIHAAEIGAGGLEAFLATAPVRPTWATATLRP